MAPGDHAFSIPLQKGIALGKFDSFFQLHKLFFLTIIYPRLVCAV